VNLRGPRFVFPFALGNVLQACSLVFQGTASFGVFSHDRALRARLSASSSHVASPSRESQARSAWTHPLASMRDPVRCLRPSLIIVLICRVVALSLVSISGRSSCKNRFQCKQRPTILTRIKRRKDIADPQSCIGWCSRDGGPEDALLRLIARCARGRYVARLNKVWPVDFVCRRATVAFQQIKLGASSRSVSSAASLQCHSGCDAIRIRRFGIGGHCGKCLHRRL